MTKISFAPTYNGDINSFVNIVRSQPVRPQVEAAIEAVGVALKGATEINLIGMPAPSVMQVAGLELAIGLPNISVIEPGRPGVKEPRYVGAFNLDTYRHKVVREYRDTAWKDGEAFSSWTVLNGSGRKVEDFQLSELAQVLGVEVSMIRVLDAPAHVIADFEDPAAGMAEKLASLPMTKADWLSGRLIVFLPGLGLGGVLFAVTAYALAERYPLVANLQSGEDRQFHLFELCDPQPMRDYGQALAVRWQADQTAKTIEEAALLLAGSGTPSYSNGVTLYVELPGNRTLVLSASSAVIV